VLAWGDHLFALALLVVPLRPLLGLTGAYNVLLLGTTAGSAYGGYLLVRLLTGRRGVSVLAGVLWSVSAYRMVEFSHIQTLSTEGIPFVFLFAEHVRRGPRPRHVVGLAVSMWFVLATNVYLGLYTVLALGVWAAAMLAVRRPPIRTWVRLAAPLLVAALAALPLYLPGIRVQSRAHLVRDLHEQSPMTLEAFRLLPPPGHLAQILGRWIGIDVVYRSNYATPGWVMVVLALIGLAAFLRTRRAVRWSGFAAIAVVALLSAQGPSFRWYGRTLLSTNPVFLVAYHLVPGYDALRIPHRWLLLGFFGLAVAVAVSVAPLADRIPRPWRIAAVVALTAFTVVEQSPAPWPVFPSYRSSDEPVYAWVAKQPADTVILELPISADVASATTQELEAKRLWFGAQHFRRRVGGGISPYIEPAYLQRALLLDGLGRDPKADAALRRWGVDYVLFDATDEQRYPGAEPADVVLARLDADPSLQRLRRMGDTTVYEIRRP
jgi:hypothetical protein